MSECELWLVTNASGAKPELETSLRSSSKSGNDFALI